jgi:energy-converting hydrogenase Eha subunit A
MVNQMLAEQGNGCAGGCNDNGNCGQNVCGGACGDHLWYSSFSVLVLNRSAPRRVWTSSEQFPNEAIQLGNTDIPTAWSWGGEVQLGRRFCCDCTPYAIEATFWTTTAITGSETTTSSLGAGTLIGTPLQTDNINFNLPGGLIVPATTIFNNASSSTVSRRDEFYDFEINLVREKLGVACNSPWEIGWSLGVRYFRFQESLSVSAITPTTIISGGADAYFNDTVSNNLVGPQIGFDLAYNIGCNARLFISPKFGVYGNCVDSNFNAAGRQGTGAYVNGTNTITGYPNFPAHGTNTGVAFLTQIDLGMDWQFTRNWSAKVGYRVVAITGMGLADDEYPQYLCDTPEMQNPQHESSLVLHGVFAGLTYNF